MSKDKSKSQVGDKEMETVTGGTYTAAEAKAHVDKQMAAFNMAMAPLHEVALRNAGMEMVSNDPEGTPTNADKARGGK